MGDLRPGEVVRGWTLVRPLGSGGQATTWLARGEDGQEVALKHFSLSSATDWKQVELAEREARVLAGLDNRSIPTFLDAFSLEGQLFLVQEYIEGVSLAQDTGHRDERALVALARQVLEILIWLHERQPPIIHRDLKPSNLLRRPDGSLVLIDFGAVQAHLEHRPDGGSTVVGTHGYMAPEQLMGRAAPSSDLYALGATLVHLASGHHPGSLPAVGLELDFEGVVNLSPALKAWLSSLLKADPRQRPASAREALASLEEATAPEETIAQEETIGQEETAPEEATSREAASRAITPSAPAPVAAPSTSSEGKGPGRAAALIGVLIAVSVGVATYLSDADTTSQREAPPPTPSPPTPSPPRLVEAKKSVELPGPDSPKPIVQVPVEEQSTEVLLLEGAQAVHRRAEWGFPMSSLYVSARITNKGQEPLAQVTGVVTARSFQRRAQHTWIMVDGTDPPLEPGETRYIKTSDQDALRKISRVEVSISATKASVALPEAREVAPEVEGAQRLPGLKVRQRRVWSPEEIYACEDKVCFDTWLEADSLPTFEYVELAPTCLDAQGQRLPYYRDRVFQVLPRRFGMEVTRPEDVYVFRVICAQGADHVSWSVKAAQR